MNQFLYRGIIFSLLFWIYVAGIVLLDPYNYFQSDWIISVESKQNISRNLSNRYWKVIEYKTHRGKNVIFGDSRANALQQDRLEKLTGEPFYNFSFAAASFDEMNEAFWYVTSIEKPNTVYMAISFNTYNKYNNKNLFHNSIEANSMHRYIFNWYNIEALKYFARAAMTGETPKIRKPNMSKEAFWQQQLKRQGSKYYSLYKYPVRYTRMLQKIADYCVAHHIELVLFQPPTHVDLQKIPEKYGLKKEREKFVQEMRSMATFINFDYPSKITLDKENFSDPFHFTQTIAQRVEQELVSQTGVYARVYKK